jgi:lipoprotein-anchoring transpeptidase ErfK/SrfK
MKVSSISTPKFIKSLIVATPLLLSPVTNVAIAEQPNKDTFEKTIEQKHLITVHDENALAPSIKVGKEYIKPTVVVDKSENKLYLYNAEGYLKASYSVGLGKKSTPTKTGLRKIVAIESYPYSKAPIQTKRHQFPNDYGPRVIVIGIVDTETGKITGFNGEFIHGTNKPESIGKNESKGCVRMHNNEVKELAKILEVGEYVLIKE